MCLVFPIKPSRNFPPKKNELFIWCGKSQMRKKGTEKSEEDQSQNKMMT